MLKRDAFGEVVRFKMGVEVQGRVSYWCAAWLVDGLLIDTGCAHCAGELLAAALPESPVQAVNTHYHEDHVGANAALIENGVPVAAPLESLAHLAEGWRLYPYQKLIWGRPRASAPAALGPEVATPARCFQVVPAPGHSHDHVAFWEPEHRWLFVGDAYLGRTPRTCRPEDDHNQTLSSLRRLAALEPRVMFTGLGEVIEDAASVLSDTADYLEEQRAAIRELAGRGRTAAEIALRLYGPESSLMAITNGQLTHENFVASFLKDKAAENR